MQTFDRVLATNMVLWNVMCPDEYSTIMWWSHFFCVLRIRFGTSCKIMALKYFFEFILMERYTVGDQLVTLRLFADAFSRFEHMLFLVMLMILFLLLFSSAYRESHREKKLSCTLTALTSYKCLRHCHFNSICKLNFILFFFLSFFKNYISIIYVHALMFIIICHFFLWTQRAKDSLTHDELNKHNAPSWLSCLLQMHENW